LTTAFLIDQVPKTFNMRALSGLIAFFTVVIIGIIMLIIEWIKKRKKNNL